MKSKALNRIKGDIAEGYACDFLVSKGYMIVERNYAKKWGEIDIIAKKASSLHFIEVKSIYRDELGTSSGIRPEENVNFTKVRHIRNMIQTYLWDMGGDEDIEFQVHVITVEVRMDGSLLNINMFENIII